MEAFPSLDFTSAALRISFFSIPGCFFTLVALFRSAGLYGNKKTKLGARLSDLMAFEIVSLLICGYLGIVGLIGWFQLYEGWDYSFYASNRFYTYSGWVQDYLLIPMLCYQFWNTLICIFWPQTQSYLMIGHHIFTAALGYFALHPFLHYYAVFFFGIAEVTNIPLTFVEIFDHFDDLREKMPIVNEVCRISFAVCFILIRMIAWPIISYDFWMGLIDLLQTNGAHSEFVVWVYLVANTFLSGLQLYWGSTIISLLIKMVIGEKEGNKKD